MKRLVSLVISLVIGCITLPLAAIAGITGGASSDPACNHQPAPTGPDRPPAASSRWDTEQLANAATIAEVGHTKQVPPWGWVIAVTTAIQESQLRNLPHLGQNNDHDSIGLFQQRPSQGWGTAAQLSDPAYQAGKFYDALHEVDQWQQMTLTQAAQAVQKSAHPDAYAQHTTDAVKLVSEVATMLGLSTAAVAGCVTISPAGWTQPVHGPVVSGYGIRAGRMHHGSDIAAPRHTIIHAAASGTITHVACNAIDRHTGHDWGCHRDGHPDRTAGCGWYADLTHPGAVTTRYCHMQTRPWVDVGDLVIAGQPIGTIGSTGHSSGPHLHYEVHQDGHSIDPQAWMDDHGAPLGTSQQRRRRCHTTPDTRNAPRSVRRARSEVVGGCRPTRGSPTWYTVTMAKRSGGLGMALARGFLRTAVWLYRRSGGRIGGKMFGAPVLLLTTTGRRSGRSWTVPLLYQPDDDRWVIIASNGGNAKHPAWWLNLRAQPVASVQIGRQTYPVTAIEATGQEREVLWRRMADLYKGYDGYAKKTTRKIPVVVLHRR